MESVKVKVAAFLLVVLAIGVCLGLSLMKFHRAAEVGDPSDAMTPEQKLEALERPGAGTDRTSNFIAIENARAEETRQAEEAVFE